MYLELKLIYEPAIDERRWHFQPVANCMANNIKWITLIADVTVTTSALSFSHRMFY